MTAKIKLITLWSGKLPIWYSHFYHRIRANKVVEHELIHLHSVDQINNLARFVTGFPCRKPTCYSLCDIRPLLGDMCCDVFYHYEWWGWCDLDIVVGNLDKLVEPLLDSYDIITADPHSICGGITFLRNIPEINRLYRSGPYQEMLSSNQYFNFDEDGRGANQGFTRIVNDSGIRVHYDDRNWHEGHKMLVEGKVPSRYCKLVGNDLIETPTEREIWMYHLGSKKWPVTVRS